MIPLTDIGFVQMQSDPKHRNTFLLQMKQREAIILKAESEINMKKWYFIINLEKN